MKIEKEVSQCERVWFLLFLSAALYAPLDGMNEKGVAISVNMIQDSAVIDQNTEKPDITTMCRTKL